MKITVNGEPVTTSKATLFELRDWLYSSPKTEILSILKFCPFWADFRLERTCFLVRVVR